MDPIEELLDEVRLLWHRMVEVGGALHAREPVTLGMRAVLEFLSRDGPATVPAIARSRHVTRQHIRAVASALLERGLVEQRENPAHKRAALLGLTAEGDRLIRRMKAKEARLLAARNFRVTAAGVRAACATLRAVRAGLKGAEP